MPKIIVKTYLDLNEKDESDPKLILEVNPKLYNFKLSLIPFQYIAQLGWNHNKMTLVGQIVDLEEV